MVCARAHSFDIARSGYINLLQPQDRRSKQPGDTAAAVLARRRLHDHGFTAPLLDAIREMAAPREQDVVLDAGCGEGFYLGGIARAGCTCHGVDISVSAIEAAAKRYPGVQWIVGNADRFLPYPDRAFSLLLSITARMNTAEFSRVLRENGRLLVAIPAPDDLIELRGTGRDRIDRTIETFSPQFILRDQRRITTTATIDPQSLEDARLAIYRPLGDAPVPTSTLTFSLDLLLFT